MAKARGKSAGGGAPTSQPPGATPTHQTPALAALVRGDVKTARRLAAHQLASGNVADREVGRRVLDESRPDPAALVAAAAVLLAILLAAWLALFRAH